MRVRVRLLRATGFWSCGAATSTPCARGASAGPRASGRADIVIPVPTRGPAPRSGTPRKPARRSSWGLIRNHYVGRTFIEPKQGIRHFGVKVKLNPMQARGGGGRLDRPRHHQPQDRQDDSRRRGQVRPRPHLLAAHPVAVLLRHRHDAQGADRLQPFDRGDLPVSGRRLARLSLTRRDAEGDRLRSVALLPRVLHRRLPRRDRARADPPAAASLRTRAGREPTDDRGRGRHRGRRRGGSAGSPRSRGATFRPEVSAASADSPASCRCRPAIASVLVHRRRGQAEGGVHQRTATTASASTWWRWA